MRQKSYYAADEIIANLYSYGEEWQTEDGIEYKGLYHKYTTGEVYTRANWDSVLSKKLVKFDAIGNSSIIKNYKKLITLKTNYQTANITNSQPTYEDRQRGYFERFFVKRKNSVTITEINGQEYQKWLDGKIDNNLYIAVKLLWYISGVVTDQYTSTYKSPGIISKNENSIKTAELVLPGISSYLTNLTEFYSNSDYIVPKDINE